MTGLLPSDAIAVGVGAVFGALARHHIGRVAADWIATDTQRLGKYQGWHTAAINVGGSFILGGVAGAPLAKSARPSTAAISKPAIGTTPPFLNGLSPRAKLLLGVGFCGSFTTFSTYSVDIATWLQNGQTTRALSYVLTNNVGGVVAAATGMMLVKKLFGR